MELISRLRELLLGIVSSQPSAQEEQAIFEALIVLKPILVKVLDVGPRRPQEQREIESGKANVNGKPLAFNADFARQVLFLAQQLDCSELHVAGLLHGITLANPHLDSARCFETTIVEFHRRRRHLADCLRLLLAEATQDAEGVHARLDEFVRRELLPGYEVTGVTGMTRVRLAQEVFNQIHVIGALISKVQADRQNAGSQTMVSTAQGGVVAVLGYNILTARLDSLKYERRSLGIILFLITRPGHLQPSEIQQITEWASINPNHPMTFYFLTIVLAAFETVDPRSVGGKARFTLAHDQDFVKAMKKLLSTATNWHDPGLQATILLRWTLFLTESRHREPDLDRLDGFKAEELESQVWNAVQGGTFSYLALAVLQLQSQPGNSSASPSLVGGLILSQEQVQLREPPDEEFARMMLHSFETLLRALIMFASSELRKIKQRQEDVVLASARNMRSSTPHIPMARSGPEAERPMPASPRNDIAILYSFIGLLYSALPSESALPFWGASPPTMAAHMMYSDFMERTAVKLPPFLHWAVWSTQPRDLDMTIALYDMLSGLAHGQQCSELAYNFLARGGSEVLPTSMPASAGSVYGGGSTVSWNVVFDLLDLWATVSTSKAAAAAPPPPPPPLQSSYMRSTSWQVQPPSPPQTKPQHPELGPGHVRLAQAFLRLLATVVRYSVPVRLAITSNAHFRAVPTLVTLLPLGVPLELKGALFESLAAFCEPGAGAPGVDICKAVWTLMERLEVINVRSSQGGHSQTLPAGKGVEVELEEVESIYKMYPATIPFLKLLTTLIHSPKRIPLKDRVADSEPINTIPEGLGQPYRLPGIGPFVSFVLDTVFAKIPTREYLRPSDRWQMNDLCLCFAEQCLASYDLESLLSLTENQHLRGESTVPYIVHPGYDIMKRLLTSSPFRASILSYIVEGVEGFEKGFAQQEPFFHSTIVRVLRIIFRVLEIQAIFLDVLVPAIAEFDSARIVGTVYSRSYFTGFDQALSFSPQYVPALASYVAFPIFAELVLLSIKITTALSTSHAFPNLLAFIERSAESERILTGVQQVMDMETMEDVAAAEAEAENATGAGAPSVGGPQERFDQAIRLAALDLFIQDTDFGRPYPNIAHFLLFGSTSQDAQIQDPHALGARRTSIHVILDLINHGIPRAGKRGEDPSLQQGSRVEPLFVILPALAERCYKVVCQLCMHPKTSDSTMRYLRTHEDFFARQIAAIPAKVPETLQDPYIEVLYTDGARVTTTVPAITSYLRLRSWILELVALDLHVLTNKGHQKGVAALLEILFGNNSAYVENSESWEDDRRQDFHEVGQSHLRIIEFVQSLNFDWSDSLVVNPVNLDLLKSVNLQSCIRMDSGGCEIVDRSAVLSLLSSARRSLHAQGRVVTQGQVEQLRFEMNYIMESCAVENHRRAVQHAIAGSYEAWRRLLDMTLAKCFHRLPHDQRENMLFDLLHVLPTAMHSPGIDQSTAVLLAEAILSLVTKLREDRRQLQFMGGDAEADALPAERLSHLLRNILECITDNSHIELVRGNLYAALINYLHLIASANSGKEGSGRRALSISLAASIRSDAMCNDNDGVFGSSRPSHSSTSLEAGSLAILKNGIGRLVGIISRDAIDGTEVWKTVAFICLDSLIQLSRSEKQQTILSALVHRGILSSFVVGLKESDIRLQAILKPDPEELNILYVYEAKMSLFIRMTQTRAGSERLLEAHILPILAQCDYLDTRPEVDQTFMHHDSFLPSAIQRYHQLLMPALQVVDGMLTTLGSKHSGAANQALEFLTSHRETIIILLKTDADELPLAVVEEMHLLISICTLVLPLVPKTELSSTSAGFGRVHVAILSLATRTLNGRPWSHTMQPQTETERLDSSVAVSTFETETKFTAGVRRKERLLRKAIIAYLGMASEFTEPEITLVLSPFTTNQKQDDQGSQFSATIPTIGDAIEALSDLCNDLSSTLKTIMSLSAEIAAKDYVRMDSVPELFGIPEAALVQDLDIADKRALVGRELERIQKAYKADAQTLLDATEMLLLVLWRHIEYYAEGHHLDDPDLKASTARMTRLMAGPDVDTFRVDLGRKLVPVLHRLDMDLDAVGDEWRSNREYMQTMRRRMKSTIGLQESSVDET